MSAITWEYKADIARDGTWSTDMATYLDYANESVVIQQGAGLDGRPMAGEVTFRIRNTQGTWSPRQQSSTFFGNKARLPIRIRAVHNATTYDV